MKKNPSILSGESGNQCVTRNQVRGLIVEHFPLLVLIAINSSVFGLLLISNQSLVFFPHGDNWIPYWKASWGIDAFISTWSPIDFGWPNSPSIGILVMGLVQLVFRNAVATEFIFNLTPYWLATFGTYVLEQKLTKSKVILVFGPLLYSYNWVSLSQFGNIELLLPFSCVPLAVYFALDAFRKVTDFRPIMGLGAMLALSCFVSPILGAFFILPSILAVYLSTLLAYPTSFLRRFVTTSSVLLASLSIFLILTLPTTLHSLELFLHGGVAGFATGAGYRINTDYLTYIGPSYFWNHLTSPLDIFAILSLGTKPISLAGELGIAVLTIASICVSKGRLRRLAALVGLMDMLFVLLALEIMGMNQRLVNSLYSSLFFLVPFNGFGVFSIVIGSLSGMLVVFGLCSLAPSTTLKSRKSTVAVVILIGIIIPGIVANGITTFSPTSSSLSKDWYQNVPTYMSNLESYFSQLRLTQGDFRVLWLPQYNWLNNMLFNGDPLSDFQEGPLLSKPVLLGLLNGIVENISSGSATGKTLAELGFHYVAVLKNPPNGPHGPISLGFGTADAYIAGNPMLFIQYFDINPEYVLVSDTPEYSIYANTFAQSSAQTIPNQSLTAQWIFGQDNGSILYDSSGYNNTGKIMNSPTWVSGNFATALNLSSLAQQYVTIPNSPSTDLSSHSFTISSWIRTKSDGNDNPILSKGFNYSKNPGYIMGLHLGRLQCGVADTSDNYIQLVSPELVNQNQWTFLTCVWNAPLHTMYAYLNGSLVSWQTDTKISTNNSASTHNLYIGSDGAGAYFSGLIAEVRLYESALTPPEVYQLSNEGQNGNIPFLQLSNGIFTLSPFANFSLTTSLPTSVIIRSQTPVLSPSKYQIDVVSSGPIWLVMSTNFDPNWVATLNDTQLPHSTSSGWANSFYIPGSGNRTITLKFNHQELSNITIYLWVGALATLTFMFIRPSFFKKLVKKINRNPHSHWNG